MTCVYRTSDRRPFMVESKLINTCPQLTIDTLFRYHGCITREEAGNILGTQDGNYLVRAGLKTPGTYSLSFVYVRICRVIQ